jgi:hypothetical protein
MFIFELTTVLFVCGRVFSGEDGGPCGESMAERVE